MSWLSSAFRDITGTSITQAAGLALPAVGTLVGGPAVGAAITGTVASLLPGETSTSAGSDQSMVNSILNILSNNRAANNQVFSQATIGAAPAVGGGGSIASRLLSLTGMAGAATAAVGIIRSVGGKILGWILPSGAKISRAAAVKLAKEVGLTAAAAAIGAGVTDLAEAIMQHEKSKGHRRHKGITAASMRTTRRTIGQVERMHHQIARLAASAVHRRPQRAPVTIIEKRR